MHAACRPRGATTRRLTAGWAAAAAAAALCFSRAGCEPADGQLAAAVNPPPQQYVLVVAQGRSGSTLFTNLLCHNRSDVFGVYEPYHDYGDVSTAGGDLNLPSGLTWQALFDCSFVDNAEVLGAVGWRGQGRHALADQIKPMRPQPDGPGTPRWGEGKRPRKLERLFRLKPGAGKAGFDARYAPYVKMACQSSSVRVVKSIRMYGWLLDQFDAAGGNVAAPPGGAPPLKIIHLIRHPVAVGKSWQRFTRRGRWAAPVGIDDFNSRLRLMCRMTSAMIVALRRMPQDRQMVVRYEDVASDPTGTLDKVFRFIGGRFNEDDKARIAAAMGKHHGPTVRSSHPHGVPRGNDTRVYHQLSEDTRVLCEPVLQLGNYTLDEGEGGGDGESAAAEEQAVNDV